MKHSVLLIGLDKDKKILLHHKGTDAPHNANQWCMLGGGIEEGETKENAIKREMKEELNCTVTHQGLHFGLCG